MKKDSLGLVGKSVVVASSPSRVDEGWETERQNPREEA